MGRIRIDGSDFHESYEAMDRVIGEVRNGRRPYLVQAKVPLLGHHTSGVRKEFYRSAEDLEEHALQDPLPKLRARMLGLGMEPAKLLAIEKEAVALVAEQFRAAVAAAEPDPAVVADHVFAPTPVTVEKGERSPAGGEKVIMVDAALFDTGRAVLVAPEQVALAIWRQLAHIKHTDEASAESLSIGAEGSSLIVTKE